MTTNKKRDNAYWEARLEKDGHDKLIAQIISGEITVYKATQLAGYRKKASTSPAAALSYHWKRANHAERMRFVVSQAKEINRVLLQIRDDHIKSKAQKSSE